MVCECCELRICKLSHSIYSRHSHTIRVIRIIHLNLNNIRASYKPDFVKNGHLSSPNIATGVMRTTFSHLRSSLCSSYGGQAIEIIGLVRRSSERSEERRRVCSCSRQGLPRTLCHQRTIRVAHINGYPS